MTDQKRKVRIGKWLLEPALNRIRNDADSITLEPRAAEVLEYLARHPRQVVSVDDLVEHVWDRRFVGDSPVYRTIADIRRHLGDDARHPEYIETIRKRGYRLVADVEWLDDAIPDPNAEKPPASPAGPGQAESPRPATGIRAVGSAIAIATLAAVAGGVFWLTLRRA